MRSRLGAALLFASFLASALLFPAATPTAAQDKKDEKKAPPTGKVDFAKQKAAVMAILKKADLPKVNIVETEHFFIATSLPEEKAKALGVVVEKVVPVARKALQFEEKEEPWRGKLTLFVLPETREFKTFIRSVVMKDPEGVYMDLRAEDPFVADSVDVPPKATDAEQYSVVAATVATAFLKARGSTASLPGWLQDGFGRVTAMRAEGTNSTRYTKYRTAARAMAGIGKGAKAVPIGEVWGETKTPNTDVMATSVVEYMAYGPGSMNFVKLIFAFRPNENGDSPATAQALEAAGWKDVAVLEKAWQKWASGK